MPENMSFVLKQVLMLVGLVGLAAARGDAQDDGKHLFILSGQSNMQGHRPEEAFTPAVEKALGKENVIVVQDALGGQPIQRWYKAWKSPDGTAPASTGDLYDRLMAKVKPAIDGQSIASITFIWMQGERDAKANWGDVYEDSLVGLYKQLSQDLGRDDIGFVIGRLSDFDLENKQYPEWTKIREIQVKVADSNKQFAWVNTDDLNDGLNRAGKQIKNDLHYAAEGYKTLGQRFASTALQLIQDSRADSRQSRSQQDSPQPVLKDLNGYFPFEVPDSKAAWQQRASDLRRQVLVATGLWPLPERTPLNPIIHGLAKRDGFTVEKVYFESMPNHFVTGLLFRPDDEKSDVKRPAVLCPHGHGGRMQDNGADNMQALIESGAEKFEESGRFPKLARCAHLARMGCVVFIFDMLGYADSQQISEQVAHRFAKQRPEFEGKENWGLFSAQAEMRLQSVMGIQTWNSIRALDFLQQLPDVDGSRLGVTGGSGGGTQTILLCAIDNRPVVAFPNGMVSTSMQGGCTCENCCLLRVGTGNVELAALFAPKPQAMTAANDWTKEMMTKGYPQLQQVYGMLGAPENVYCRPMLHFPHNYNYVSRATMYEWFNKHLELNQSEAEIVERDYRLLTPEESTVWNAEHPKPAGGESYERELLNHMADVSDQQISALTPSDEASLAKYRASVGGAFDTMFGSEISAADITRTKVAKQQRSGYLYFKDQLSWSTAGDQLTFDSLYPSDVAWNGQVVIVVDGQARGGLFNEAGELRTSAVRILESGAALLRIDLRNPDVTEQPVVENPRESAAYTFGYNPTLFTQRVQDVVALITFVHNDEHETQGICLLGIRGGGPIAAAAGMQAGSLVDKAVVDTRGFRFADITSYRDPNFVPGVVKYGDLPAILALNAPHALMILGEQGKLPAITEAVYRAAGKGKDVVASSSAVYSDEVLDWMLKK